MTAPRKNKPFSDEEKALVTALKECLNAAGVNKFPADWHLKQLSTARRMLAGESAPDMAEWLACMKWAFDHPYWQDKVDHLARILALWPKYKLGGDTNGTSGQCPRRSTQRDSYRDGEQYANEGEMPFWSL